MVREKDANGSPLLGEWVVEHELRPWTDKLLGRLRDKSDGDADDDEVPDAMTGVLFSRRHSSNDGTLEVRFTDGRTLPDAPSRRVEAARAPEVAVADPPSRGDLWYEYFDAAADMLSN